MLMTTLHDFRVSVIVFMSIPNLITFSANSLCILWRRNLDTYIKLTEMSRKRGNRTENYKRSNAIVFIVLLNKTIKFPFHVLFKSFFLVLIFLYFQILSKDMDEVINSSDFERTVQNFDNNFSKYLLGLLNKLSSFSKTDFQHQMLNIVTRLDHNGFYGKQLEKMAASGAGRNIICAISWIKLNLTKLNWTKPNWTKLDSTVWSVLNYSLWSSF